MSELTYAVKEIRKRYDGDIAISDASAYIKEKLAAGVDVEDAVDNFFDDNPERDKEAGTRSYMRAQKERESHQADLCAKYRASIEEGLKAFGLDDRISCSEIEPDYYDDWYRVSLTVDSKSRINSLCVFVEGAITNTGNLVNEHGVDAFSAFMGMIHSPSVNSGPRA